MKKNTKKLLLIGVFVSCLVLISLYVLEQTDNYLHLTICDIGQGDAILVSYKKNQVLIDGGKVEASKQLLYCLQGQMPFWDRTIEAVVSTHPDEDHFGGFLEVLSRYRVENFFHSGFDNLDNSNWQQLKKQLSEQKVCTNMVGVGDQIRVGMLYFEGLFPRLTKKQAENDLQDSFFNSNKKCGYPSFPFRSDNLNNNSVVLQLRFGKFDALLTGDLETEGEQILAWRKKLEPVEILKVGHHGAKTSTSKELLTAVKPELALISVGENSFGHPNEEVLKRLSDLEIEILRTDREGTIEIVSDGEKYWIGN